MTGVVNGFKIHPFHEGNRQGIFVIYKIDGKSYTESKIYDVDEEKIEKIRARLENDTNINKEAKELCEIVAFITILHRVFEIV